MSNWRATVKALAEQCAASVRTIQRDLDALSLAGIPVSSSPGYGGGVGLLKGFTLHRTFISAREQADKLHCPQALQGAGYAHANESLNTFAALFRKKAKVNCVRLGFSSWCASGFDKEKFDRLKQAILAKKVITLTYFSSENRISE